MDKENYHLLLDTVSITLDCLNATTTCYLPELGTVSQSIWSEKEIDQFKEQLKGLMRILPTAKQFS